MNRRELFKNTSIVTAGSFLPISLVGKEPEITEWEKCKQDIVYFVNNYVGCNGLDVKLTPEQERLLLHISSDDGYINPNLVRQYGKSLLLCCYAVHSMIFKENMNIRLITMNNVNLNILKRRIIGIIDNLPDSLIVDGNCKYFRYRPYENDLKYTISHSCIYFMNYYKSLHLRGSNSKNNEIVLLDEYKHFGFHINPYEYISSKTSQLIAISSLTYL